MSVIRLLMNRYFRILLLALLPLVACCCSRDTDDHRLEEALRFAGDNRAQLQQVLDHYAGDSLKLAAAQYLITNMPGHYSYADTDSVVSYSRQVGEICARMQGFPFEQIRDSINACASRCGIQKVGKAFDSRVVTADFLIHNIDEAFRSWQQGRWARHLCFDEFCEYLLPYKAGEMQLLDDWRTRMQGFQCQGLERLDWCDQYAHSALQAAKVVNANLHDLMHPDHGANIEFQNMRMEDAVRLPMGTCDFYVLMATILLRSQGIPVVVDFTPHWAYRNIGHSWNVVLTNEGREVPFTGICTQPGDEHKPDERMPKTYRCTYAQNVELQRLNRREKFVPRLFRNVFMRDVSSHYAKCYDVTLPVNARHGSYAYLAVYDVGGWAPVAYAEVKQGKATFTDMGYDVLYLPLRYHADGREEVLGPPFVLEHDGSVRTLGSSARGNEHVTAYRRYPALDYVYNVMCRIEGGQFQAANRPDSASYHTVATLTDGHAYGRELELPDSVPAYRYWRYKQDRSLTHCNMAEMQFYERGTGRRLHGRVIGTEGSFMNRGGRRECVFDGDVLTFFDAPNHQYGWVGLDFDKPVSVGRIYYVFRGDGNTIEPGDTYQLYCWQGKDWALIDTRQAKHPWIRYDHMSPDGIYLLRNKTRGSDMRPFTCEQGRQVWW